jgi:myo-inositol catabolism protein IolC
MESTYLDESGAPRRLQLGGLLGDGSDAQLVAAHVDHGYTITDIARHLGADRSQISRRLKQLALPARRGSDPDRARTSEAPVMDDRVHDRFQTLFVHGHPLEEPKDAVGSSCLWSDVTRSDDG